MNKDAIKKKMRMRVPLWAICLVMVVVLIVVGMLVIGESTKKGKPEIITKSHLEKIIDVSELSTFESKYNGVAQVMNEKNNEKIDYYVSYEAKMKAGIDFEKVQIAVDSENKKIVVTLPEIVITETNVDITTLDYIFYNQKANTTGVSEDAYKACIADVEAESVKQSAIKELAYQNAQNVIEALIRPFVEMMDEEYELEIK